MRVVLIADPFGETGIGAASIEVNGRTVGSLSGEEPGETVYVRARVGPA